MRTCIELALALLQGSLMVLASVDAQAQGSAGNGPDVTLALREIPQWLRSNADGPLAAAAPLIDQTTLQSATQMEVRSDTTLGPMSGHLLWTGTWTVTRSSGTSGSGILDALDIESRTGDWRFMAGKKAMSWDVGYGFRPLDVIQRENRRALYQYVLEGVPMLAAETLNEDSALLFVVANPGTSMAGTAPERESRDGSLALRIYHRTQGTDLYGVSRLSRRDGLQAGASVAFTPNDSLEVHASLLAQQRHGITIATTPWSGVLTSDTAPVLSRDERRGPSASALVGMTWSDSDGDGLVLEAWYDGTTYTGADWARLRSLEAAQQASLATPGWHALSLGGLATDARYDNRDNLRQTNVLAHLSRKVGNWTPALDLLLTPQDKGRVATLSCAHEGDRVTWDSALRWLTGPDSSAYRRAPDKVMWYLGVTWFWG